MLSCWLALSLTSSYQHRPSLSPHLLSCSHRSDIGADQTIPSCSTTSHITTFDPSAGLSRVESSFASTFYSTRGALLLAMQSEYGERERGIHVLVYLLGCVPSRFAVLVIPVYENPDDEASSPFGKHANGNERDWVWFSSVNRVNTQVLKVSALG